MAVSIPYVQMELITIIRIRWLRIRDHAYNQECNGKSHPIHKG